MRGANCVFVLHDVVGKVQEKETILTENTTVYCLSTVINLASDLIITMRAPPPPPTVMLCCPYRSETHLVHFSLVLDSLRYYPQRLSEPDAFYPVLFLGVF